MRVLIHITSLQLKSMVVLLVVAMLLWWCCRSGEATSIARGWWEYWYGSVNLSSSSKMIEGLTVMVFHWDFWSWIWKDMKKMKSVFFFLVKFFMFLTWSQWCLVELIIKGYFRNNGGWKDMILFFQIYIVGGKIRWVRK